MHPAQIKAALEMAGFTQAAIARQVIGRLGRPVTPTAVGRVVNGRGRSAVIARAISQAVSIPVARLWPGKYPTIELAEAAPEVRRRRVQAVNAPLRKAA